MPLRARREPRLPLRWHGGRIVSRWTSTSSRPIVRREGRSPEGSGDMSFPWALPTNRPPLPLVGFARQFDPRSLRKRARTRINRATWPGKAPRDSLRPKSMLADGAVADAGTGAGGPPGAVAPGGS